MRLSEDLLTWVTLSRAPALDALNVATALERLDSVKELAASDAARERAGLPAAAREYLRTAAPPCAAERRWLEHERHYLVPFTDSRYPKLLHGLVDRPLLLYLAGNIDTLGEPQLAVVG